MIALKCPTCGNQAELPERLAVQAHQCYRCGVRLEIADPRVAAQRMAVARDRDRELLLGAILDETVVPIVGILGGAIGMAIIATVAGMLLGGVMGIVWGLV